MESPHDAHPKPTLDTFVDLEQDGWYVDLETLEGISGKDVAYKSVRLMPPGYSEEADAEGQPVVHVRAVQDTALGVTVKGAVQSWDDTGERHAAFRQPGRAASELTRRAIVACNADRMMLHWVRGGGGLGGSVNYDKFVKTERALREASFQERLKEAEAGKMTPERSREIHRKYERYIPNLAAYATWSYNRVAQPLGFTDLRQLEHVTVPRWHSSGNGKPFQPFVTGYFVRPNDPMNK